MAAKLIGEGYVILCPLYQIGPVRVGLVDWAMRVERLSDSTAFAALIAIT